MHDKINYVYTAFPHLGAAYFGTHGLVAELKRTGRLHYEYNTQGGDFINEEELVKYPILFMNGHTLGKVLDVAKDQFRANYHSESYFTRHGKVVGSGNLLMERQNQFDIIFYCAEADADRFSIPSVFCSVWADTNVMYPMERETSKRLFFMGGLSGREDFLMQDRRGDIVRQQTEFHKDPFTNVMRYTDLMANYLHIVNPPGRLYNGVTGRIYEILACGRLCYQFYNPDTMFRTLKEFEDGKHVVYFKTMDELLDKYEYYKSHEAEAWEIAKAGHQKFLDGHTQVHRAEFLVNEILDRANCRVGV